MRTCSWPWPTASQRWRLRGTTKQVGTALVPRQHQGAAPAPHLPPAELAVPRGYQSGSCQGLAAPVQWGTNLPPKQSSGTAPCSEHGAGVVCPHCGAGGEKRGWGLTVWGSPAREGSVLPCLLAAAQAGVGGWGGPWCGGTARVGGCGWKRNPWWGSRKRGRLPALAPGDIWCPQALPAPLSMPALQTAGAPTDAVPAAACPGWVSCLGLSLLAKRGVCMGSAWCLVSVSSPLDAVAPACTPSSSVPPLQTLPGHSLPCALAWGRCPPPLPTASVTLSDAHRCSHPHHCPWSCLGSPLSSGTSPLPLPSPGPRRVSRVLLCPPSACLPRCVLRLLRPGTVHTCSPMEAVPTRTPLCPCTATPCHPLPPAPSGSVGCGGGAQQGLWLSNTWWLWGGIQRETPWAP